MIHASSSHSISLLLCLSLALSARSSIIPSLEWCNSKLFVKLQQTPQSPRGWNMSKDPRPLQMDQKQSPWIVWCAGIKANEDVSICLVPNSINERVTSSLCNKKTIAELKVHSNQLKNCSKYFEVCLSQRWADPNSSTPSMEFNLEMIHGLQVVSYIDCFSRMYSPSRKGFKGVKSSLELLQVASQIEFHKLISSICRYLSTIKWSEEDELRIRQYSTSVDFSHNQAKDLVVRLALDSKEDCVQKLCDVIRKNIRIALCLDKTQHSDGSDNVQSYFEDLFQSIGKGALDFAFEETLVMIVNKEAMKMLVDFHEVCSRYVMFHETVILDIIETIPKFGIKLKAIGWLLKMLLRAQVAEEVVECFLHLELYPKILEGAAESDSFVYKLYVVEFARIVLLIHQEAVSGNLLLGIPERVALLENWNLIWFSFHKLSKNLRIFHLTVNARENEVLTLSTEQQVELVIQAREDVFLTLPFQQQMKLLLKRGMCECPPLIRPNSFASLVKRLWPAQKEVMNMLLRFVEPK